MTRTNKTTSSKLECYKRRFHVPHLTFTILLAEVPYPIRTTKLFQKEDHPVCSKHSCNEDGTRSVIISRYVLNRSVDHGNMVIDIGNADHFTCIDEET